MNHRIHRYSKILNHEDCDINLKILIFAQNRITLRLCQYQK
jgi:hypothetical protein